MPSSDKQAIEGPDASRVVPCVLAVDLDGTLCRTDTLHEALLGLLTDRPGTFLKMPRWLRQGRAVFKTQIADLRLVDAQTLPLNEVVVERVRAARAEGRRTVLITASDQRQADAIASETGLFDDVFGSSDGYNLKAGAKADFLTERYGKGGFDYIGDARADLPIWAQARRAITISNDHSLRRAAASVNSDCEHLDIPGQARWALLRALRPHQWSKNILVFLPLLAAHDLGSIISVFLGFLAFCAAASSAYVINDMLDLSADRAHPRKRHRPFASGELTVLDGAKLAAGLLGASFAFGLLSGSPMFAGVLAIYLAATLAYSLMLKHRLIIDVLALAGLYTIRIVAGGAIAGLTLSPWLLGFSMFLFLGLAAVKRQAELIDQLKTRQESSGRAYKVEDLPLLLALALSSGIAAVLVLSLYIASDDVQVLYGQPQILWLLCPIVLYWILRIVMSTHRGNMTDDPIVFAATDRTSQATIVLAMVVAIMSA